MMMWGWGGDGAWGWTWALTGLVSMLLFWGFLAFLVFWVARALRGPAQTSTPLEIAKRRYASGEITREQFEQLRRDLSA